MIKLIIATLIGMLTLAGCGTTPFTLPPIQFGEISPPQINTPNVPPTADAGGDLNAVVGDLVTLDGALSDDANGDGLTWTWVLSVGTGVQLSNANQAIATFRATTPGTFEFVLTVSDGRGGRDSDAVRVNVGLPPGGSPSTPPPGTTPPTTQPSGEVTLDVPANGSNISREASQLELRWSSPEAAKWNDWTFTLDTPSGGTVISSRLSAEQPGANQWRATWYATYAFRQLAPGAYRLSIRNDATGSTDAVSVTLN